MAATGTVTINIVGDATRLKSALNESESGLDRFSAKMSQVGDRLVSTGLKMTAGITLPLAFLGKRAFDAASDLEESLNKVAVVFEDSAADIRKWSQNAATAFGLSRQAALEAAGTFGNLFRSMGIALPTASEMSRKLVQLAADLASFNNASPEDALLALRAGLVGEIEPLRRFGVSLSQARIEQKAMELGIWDGVDAISASAKAQAAYAIILEDTTLAQGDFARTADSAANQQRIMRAQFEDTAAKLGEALLPIFIKVSGAIQDVAAWFSRLSPAVQEIIVYFGLALAVLGPLVTAFGAAAKAISGMSSAIQFLSASAMSPWLVVAGLVIGAVMGLSQAFGDGTLTIRTNAAAMDEATEAQMRNFAQTVISKVGYEAFTRVVKQLAEESTATAQRLVDAADLNRQHRDQLTEAINREAAAQERAAIRSREDAAAKAASTQATYDRIQASRALTEQLAREAIGGGFVPEMGFVPPPPQDPFFPPGFADGGVVPGAPGSPQLILAHGGEVVLNKDQQKAGVGGLTIGSLTVVAPDPESAADRLVRRLRTEAFLAGM